MCCAILSNEKKNKRFVPLKWELKWRDANNWKAYKKKSEEKNYENKEAHDNAHIKTQEIVENEEDCETINLQSAFY